MGIETMFIEEGQTEGLEIAIAISRTLAHGL
jgi:hypothetical protein